MDGLKSEKSQVLSLDGLEVLGLASTIHHYPHLSTDFTDQSVANVTCDTSGC